MQLLAGGAAAVATFISAVKQRAADIIYIIEPKVIGPGIAFSSLDDDILCNTSVGIMSIVYDQQNDFLEYLKECGIDATRDSYVSRSLVGKYLNRKFLHYRDIARKNGVKVFQIHDEFKSLKRIGHCKYIINFCNPLTQKINVTDVIFCTGYGKPKLPNVLIPYREIDTLVCCPYPEKDMLKRVKYLSRILVIGSKLSAVDSAILLGREGHEVTMISPSGELASVRSRFIRINKNIEFKNLMKIMTEWDLREKNCVFWTPKHAFLRFVLRTLSTETLSSWKLQFSFLNNYKDILKEEIFIAKNGNALWQDLLADFAFAINEFYINNNSSDLPKEIKEIIHRYITGLALPNAKKILMLIDAKKLHVRKGTLKHVHLNPSWSVDWGEGVEQFDAIVLATGFYLPSFILNLNNELEIDTEEKNKTSAIKITNLLSIKHPDWNENESIWFVGPPAHTRIPLPNAMFIIVSIAEQVISGIKRLTAFR